VFHSCGLEPEYYSQVAPSTYFDSQDKVYQRFARPFTHWAANIGGVPMGSMTASQTITTDEILMPNRNGDWYDDGFYLNAYYHRFAPATDSYADSGWDAFSMGIAQAWNALEDIDRYVDFDALEFPAGTRESMLNQLKVLVAYYYWFALDHFGGVPLYTSNEGEASARATDQETFDFAENLLKEALPLLPKRTAGQAQNGTITQGVAASLLARLYFNAVPYIKKDMYAECAQICEGIINGTYGSYAPASSFQEIFGFGNEACNELIWVIPSDKGAREVEAGRRAYGTHYGTWAYFQNPDAMSWNGLCLVPSLDINGKSYWGNTNPAPTQYKLGSPYAKFENTDLRKKNYLYLGEGKYEGMFLAGKLVNPNGGACIADGSREYLKGDTLAMVDQIAQLAPDILDDPATPENEARPRYPNGRQEGAMYAEENSGVRLLKYSPTPTAADNALRFTPDVPVIRLTEIIYTLAECKYRKGDAAGAAQLINNIRGRYFIGGADPNPVPASFDEYRLLDEWLIEFLGESRRRTDLVRWNKFTTEAWWDHPADGPGKEHFNRLPIPAHAINANNKLEQNPGY
ncbi:MAG: RagB/SusD family nutrient uptake outer membrane protein, partial [Mediterranea sp.]|nr:RagB/SusD family nutrient uptake outer membrane protein [Mediterranea sp.]